MRREDRRTAPRREVVARSPRRRRPDLQRDVATVEVIERADHLALPPPLPTTSSGSYRSRRSSVLIADQLAARRSPSLTAPRATAAFASWTRLRSPWAPTIELDVEARQVLLHRGLGDDELRCDRSDRRRLGERVARQQRAAEGQEHVALARRERRRRAIAAVSGHGGAVEQQAQSPEEDLVAGVQRPLADDPPAVHERAVARAEVADAPRVAEALEDGMNAGDAVRVHDHVVRARGFRPSFARSPAHEALARADPRPPRSCPPPTPIP